MKLNVRVGDIMTTSVKRVDADDSIDKAAQIMRNEHVGSVVVMGEKQVKGIVTATDIVYKHVASKTGERVKDIMSTALVKIAPSATIEDAAHLMVKNSVEKLLVFDGDNFVGLITSNDVLRVEPAIVEILLERTKMGVKSDASVNECESCSLYSDSVEDVDGVYLCAECRLGEEE